MSGGRNERDDHLRGIRGRSAEDAGHGNPRPDEPAEAAERPPAIQATHGGMPVQGPLAETMDDTGAGRESRVTGDQQPSGHSRYRRPGAEAEGAFGEEEPE